MPPESGARRREIANAVLDLIARGGVRTATVRAVAAETGLSVGSVRHFFGSQDELRRFAMAELVAVIEARVAAGARDRTERAAGGGVLEVVEAAAEVGEALLPLDGPRAQQARVYAAFLAEAPTDTGIAAIRDEAAGRLHDAVAGVVTSMAELGALGAGRDWRAETDRLWAMLDGLAAHLLDHPDRVSPERARAVLRSHLVELTGPRPNEGRR